MMKQEKKITYEKPKLVLLCDVISIGGCSIGSNPSSNCSAGTVAVSCKVGVGGA